MSRVILAVAFLLMASTVSAQTSSNVTFWTNSVTCGAGNTTDGAGAFAVTSFQVPNTNTGCTSQLLANGWTVNVTSWCNNSTGEVSVNVFNSSSCTGTPLTTLTSGGCNTGFVNNTVSATVAACPIVSTPTPTASPAPTGNPNGTTTGPTTAAPTQPTNGTTPKPGVAAQTGASFSMLAAAAAVMVAALL